MPMVVFQTIFVYTFLFVIMYMLSKQSAIHNKQSYIIIALILYSATMGLRYGVGVDYFSYVNLYNAIVAGYDHEDIGKELGFTLLMKLFAFAGLDITLCFTAYAFIQIFFIFYLFKCNKEIYPFLVLTFMLGGEWLAYCNIIRHMLAFAFFVYSLKFVKDKNWVNHYLFIILSILFHKSAFILIIVYPLYYLKESYFNKRGLQFLCLVISLVLMKVNLIQEFVKRMDVLMMLLGYSDKYGMDERMDEEVSLGPGFVLELSIVCLIIYLSPKIKQYYKNIPVGIMYDLFFVGVLIKYSFIGSMLIQRMNVYFIDMTFILSAICITYLSKIRKGKSTLLKRMYILLYILLFGAILYRMEDNSAMFIFNFQNSLFNLKSGFWK